MDTHLAAMNDTLSPQTAEALRIFQTGVAELLADKQAAGLSYSTLDADGNVVWVHPDGTVSASRNASSVVA